MKFHVINVDILYRALVGRSRLHDNYVVPYTLYQCMKYKMGGREFVIKGDIQPFNIHEIRYEDTRYFL